MRAIQAKAKLMAELMLGGHKPDFIAATGLHWQTVTNFLKALEREDLLYTEGGKINKYYQLRTQAELMKAKHDKTRNGAQAADETNQSQPTATRVQTVGDQSRRRAVHRGT